MTVPLVRPVGCMAFHRFGGGGGGGGGGANEKRGSTARAHAYLFLYACPIFKVDSKHTYQERHGMITRENRPHKSIFLVFLKK